VIPPVRLYETVNIEGLTVEKLSIESEPGMIIPSVLIKPEKIISGSPVYLFTSEKGKPNRIDINQLPFSLAKNGAVVLAIDVRGTGETSPTVPLGPTKYTGYTPLLWKHQSLAIQSANFGRTMLGMRTYDLIRVIDFIQSREDLNGKKIVVIGEGSGGLLALAASIYDPRINGIATIGTLPSYKLLVTNQYYNVWEYFWVPGALIDYDIPDLARLVAPKPQVWIDPVDHLGAKLSQEGASSILGKLEKIQIVNQDRSSQKEIISLFNKVFK